MRLLGIPIPLFAPMLTLVIGRCILHILLMSLAVRWSGKSTGSVFFFCILLSALFTVAFATVTFNHTLGGVLVVVMYLATTVLTARWIGAPHLAWLGPASLSIAVLTLLAADIAIHKLWPPSMRAPSLWILSFVVSAGVSLVLDSIVAWVFVGPSRLQTIRLKAGLCPLCTYPVTGGVCCPECGHQFVPTPAPDPTDDERRATRKQLIHSLFRRE